MQMAEHVHIITGIKSNLFVCCLFVHGLFHDVNKAGYTMSNATMTNNKLERTWEGTLFT